MKQTCQITNEKTGNWHRSETLGFEEVSDSSPYRKTDIVQLKKDSRYIGRVIMCRGNKIKIQWAKGLAESLNSDKINLFIQMVRGEQILLGKYAFQKGDRVQTNDKNFDNVILTVKECFPSGMVGLKFLNDTDLLLPGCGLTIVEEDF